MKPKMLIIALLFSVALAAAYTTGSRFSTATAAETKEDAVLRHVVLFKFKADASKEAVQKVEEAFAALPGKVSQIQDYEWGTNVSPEKLDQGYTHCFFLTFKSAEDRDAYLVHPDHKAFGSALGGVLDGACVVDYWVK